MWGINPNSFLPSGKLLPFSPLQKMKQLLDFPSVPLLFYHLVSSALVKDGFWMVLGVSSTIVTCSVGNSPPEEIIFPMDLVWLVCFSFNIRISGWICNLNTGSAKWNIYERTCKFVPKMTNEILMGCGYCWLCWLPCWVDSVRMNIWLHLIDRRFEVKHGRSQGVGKSRWTVISRFSHLYRCQMRRRSHLWALRFTSNLSDDKSLFNMLFKHLKSKSQTPRYFRRCLK